MNEQRNSGRKRFAAVVSMIAGAALLMGGGTYALWSATTSLTAGTITAGNLALANGTTASYDVSTDRADVAPVTDGTNPLTFADASEASTANAQADSSFILQGHTVDLTTWLMVPGDTVAAAMPYTVTLTGDNMVASLEMNSDAVLSGANTSMSYFYAIFDSNGNQIGTTTPVGTAANTPIQIALFQANGTDQTAGVDDTVASGVLTTVDATGIATGTVVLFAYFDKTATSQMNVADTLGSVTLTLQQVRAGTQQFK